MVRKYLAIVVMKKIKDWVKENVLYLILGIVLIVISLTIIQKCSLDKAKQLVEQTQIDQWKSHYKDSIDLSYLKIDSVRLDSVKRADSIKTEFHKKRADNLQKVVNRQDKTIKKLQGEANAAVSDYENDTTAHSEKCDSAISKLQQVNDSLYTQTDSLKAECEELDLEAEGYSRQLYDSNLQLINKQKEITIKDNSLLRANEINQQLRDQIKKDNNWWHRNEKWFFFGGGVILTGLILR